MAVEPGDRVDQLNYLATIQHDLEEARQGANEMYSSIERKREADKYYDALQDRSALKVARVRIDALQKHLDAHIAEHGLVVNQGAHDLANEVYNLGTVIGDYLSEYLTTSQDVGAAQDDAPDYNVHDADVVPGRGLWS